MTLGLFPLCGREYGAEIEFMSQDHKFLLCGIHYNFVVWSIRATNLLTNGLRRIQMIGDTEPNQVSGSYLAIFSCARRGNLAFFREPGCIA
jgi:hypothetical protein